MNKLKVVLLVLVLASVLLSFNSPDLTAFEFSYPKRDGTTVTFEAEGFKKFKKEWRGTDYYYSSESKNDIICSILYYKLTDKEKLALVDAPKVAIGGPDSSPAYPLSYFSNYSNLKQYEKNDFTWGEPTDDFMFRQNDITEFSGVKIRQKHMYGYCMAGNDLFVNIHLSKVDYSPTDSTAMRQILSSLKIKR